MLHTVPVADPGRLVSHLWRCGESWPQYIAPSIYSVPLMLHLWHKSVTFDYFRCKSHHSLPDSLHCHWVSDIPEVSVTLPSLQWLSGHGLHAVWFDSLFVAVLVDNFQLTLFTADKNKPEKDSRHDRLTLEGMRSRIFSQAHTILTSGHSSWTLPSLQALMMT